MNDLNKKEQTAPKVTFNNIQIKRLIIEVINKKGGSLNREDIYSDIEQQINVSKLTESDKSTVRKCISDNLTT